MLQSRAGTAAQPPPEAVELLECSHATRKDVSMRSTMCQGRSWQPSSCC